MSAAPNGSTAASVTPPVSDVQSPLHDLVYVFKVSRRAHPAEFRNLWQLMVMTPSDTRPMELVDADSLSTVIDKISLVFEQDGL